MPRTPFQTTAFQPVRAFQPHQHVHGFQLSGFQSAFQEQLEYVGVAQNQGAVISDLYRSTGIEGDGLNYDSSVGLWQACNFNYHNFGGAENADASTPPTGYNSGGSANITISASGDFSKFGVSSFKGVVIANGTANYAQEATMSGTDAAGKVWTSTVWAYVPAGSSLIGKSYTWKVQEIEGGAWNLNQGSTSGTFAQGWQRLVLTYTTIAANIDNLNCEIDWTATAAETLYTDGWQIEPNPLATPYVETFPNNRLSRDAGYVLGPASVISVTQGWVALRLRVGFASTADPYAGTAINLWNWAATTTNRFQIFFNPASDSFGVAVFANTTGKTASSGSLSFSSGTIHTLIAQWNGSNVSLSYNGASFANTAYAGAPVGLPAQWMLGGRQDVLGQYADSDFLWMLAGTGTLTNSDAATIHANGDTDPASTPGSPTFGAAFDIDDWFTPTGLASQRDVEPYRILLQAVNRSSVY